MTLKGNYHTHTTWCDGKAAPEAFIQTAIDAGLEYLGFSAHACFPFDDDWHMKVTDYRDYFTNILELKDKYKDRIQILTGLEADWIPPATAPDYKIYKGLPLDYIIGSVHFGGKKGDASPDEWVGIDASTEHVAAGLKNVFGGDGKAFVKDYYERVRDMALSSDCDIIGHPDLIRLRNTELGFFNEDEEWYKDEIRATAEAFAKSGKVVEINTGAMSRGLMTTPYPSLDFLKMMKEHGVHIMINSDSHTPETLLYGFDEAQQLARAAGYTELWYLTREGWQTQAI